MKGINHVFPRLVLWDQNFSFRVRLFHWKLLLKKYFSKNNLRKNILQKKEKKREIKIRKIFFSFQIRKIFYRKMILFSVDQENIFSWPLIFRETNTRKCWKYFSESYFQWNKRTLNSQKFYEEFGGLEAQIRNVVGVWDFDLISDLRGFWWERH